MSNTLKGVTCRAINLELGLGDTHAKEICNVSEFGDRVFIS